MSKILVIDDNELIGKMLKEALSEQGYEVQVAMDANQGYAAAVEVLPDLMLIDVQLPDIVGFDLIRIIKNREDLQHIPIIMITGTAHKTEEKVKAFKSGVDDYILKPFEMPELLERVAAVLRRSKRHPVEPPVPKPAANKVNDPPMGNLSASKIKAAEPPIVKKSEPPSPAAPPSIESLTLLAALRTILLTPDKFPARAAYPNGAMAFLMTALILCFSGLVTTAGATVKPAIVGLAVGGLWGVLVAVLVMTASLVGVSLSWKEGARLLSLAGGPVLLKLGAALLCSLVTTLSPFYFTAGPAIFFNAPPGWVERLDLFELWAAFLVWILIRQRPGSSNKKAGIVAAVVWVTAALIAIGLGNLGTGQ